MICKDFFFLGPERKNGKKSVVDAGTDRGLLFPDDDVYHYDVDREWYGDLTGRTGGSIWFYDHPFSGRCTCGYVRNRYERY